MAGGGGSSGRGAGGLIKTLGAIEELTANRYVNAQGVPVASGAAPFAEFNLMPVHLKLLMDQRRIPHLLTNCANSPLLVEVRRVNLNAEDAGQKRSGGAGGVALGGGRRGAAGGIEEVMPGPYDLEVEVFGFVYLFNPPDPKLVGTGAGAAEGGPAAAAEEGEEAPPAAAESGAAAAPPDASDDEGVPVNPTPPVAVPDADDGENGAVNPEAGGNPPEPAAGAAEDAAAEAAADAANDGGE